jgi:integrase
MPLTVLQVRNAKPGRHGDGKGLYLLVKPSPDDPTAGGAKSWVLRVVLNGRRRDFGLGSADLVSLSDAREKALEGRKLATQGIDPALHWKKEREEIPTFEEAARRYHTGVKAGWKNDKHAAQWLSTLEQYAFPLIGARPVDRIEAADVQSVLVPIWLTVPETARRVRQRIGAVLDFSHGQGWRSSEAPMRAVAKGLPRQGKTGKHFDAMPYSAVPAFMAHLEGQQDSMGRLAVRFTILCAARSGETRGATWDEIDLEAAVWTVPAERMKAKVEHSVPLPPPAVAILRTLAAARDGKPGELLFKGLKGPLSDMTLTKALRDAGVPKHTVHGFRSSFRDWVAEQTSFPGEWAEAALAHTLPNKVEAAYRRTKYLDQRRQLMKAWADFLGGKANVVALAAAR